MNYEKLDIRIIKSWRIARFIVLVVFFIAFAGIGLLLKYNDAPEEILYWVIPVMSLILIYRIVAVIVYPMIEYKQWSYLITEEKVEIKFGIFFVTTTIIPVIRIQHISISTGPINRKLGLSKVEIHTASGLHKIEGLSKEKAEVIAENLKSKLVTRMQKEE